MGSGRNVTSIELVELFEIFQDPRELTGKALELFVGERERRKLGDMEYDRAVDLGGGHQLEG